MNKILYGLFCYNERKGLIFHFERKIRQTPKLLSLRFVILGHRPEVIVANAR